MDVSSTPILLVGYNRPDKFVQLINSLRVSKPPKILVAIDGPKHGNFEDAERVLAVRASVSTIDWTDDIEIRERQFNMGLRLAMIDGISWAVSKEGKVIVVEDDVIVGPNFIDFCTYYLNKFKSDRSIGQINGWNQVPYEVSNSNGQDCRLSIYNTSYAWATWADRWDLFDDKLEWGLEESLARLSKITGSYRSAIQWRLNFKNANEFLVDSWSYRWLATMWSHQMWCVTPNRSLITYDGQCGGTHTRTTKSHFQNEVDAGSLKELLGNSNYIKVDGPSEKWLRRQYFDDSLKGLLKTFGARYLLKIIK